MNIGYNAHLSYCTNIHAGESWRAVFDSLKEHCTVVKTNIAGDAPFGIGLRLSGLSSVQLLQGNHLTLFKSWLHDNGMYVFTINGFPYGSFHGETVKDNVHTPDWTTDERVAYTIRLFTILAELLPQGMEGSISTSPLSYRYWHTSEQLAAVRKAATENMIKVVAALAKMQQDTGCRMHLDIEPEPDGILETTDEYIAFMKQDMLVYGAGLLAGALPCSLSMAREYIRSHIQLCYDVCHFAVGYESAAGVIGKMEQHGLAIGKMQISAALKCKASDSIPVASLQECLRAFDEPTYLHQAVVQLTDKSLLRFRDLGDGIAAMQQPGFSELRAHFHVPVFTAQYQLLESTQSDIIEALELWNESHFTRHIEVETYTWQVLPARLQAGLTASIERELQWVLDVLKTEIIQS